MRVFLTGSESFIGRELRRQALAAGHEVAGIDVAEPTFAGGVRGDILGGGLGGLPRAGDVLVHLAAVSTDALCRDRPLEALDVNVAGTLEVLRVARAAGCRQVIFASSEWVYGDCVPGFVQSEDARPAPAGVYAESKLMGERLCLLSGLPNVTVLRFGICYGPRPSNWCAVESILNNARDGDRRGEAVTVASLRTARRFVHVEDLARGVLAACGRGGQETFNLPGGQLLTLQDVIETAGQVLRRSVSYRDTGGTPSVRNPLGVKARDVLGWEPRIGLRDGMAGVLEYLKGRDGGVNG